MYTGWGLSLIIGPTIAQFSKKYVIDNGLPLTQSYHIAYKAAIGLIVVSFILAYLVKKPKFIQSEVIDDYILSPEETRK